VSKRDKVHLYTLCWNDRRMLPHFFAHYSPIVDRFYVFDNGSTDGSLELLGGDERVQVAHFQTEFDSIAETALRLSEEKWKQSRGLAEWVLVVDMDEHLYHEDLGSYLRLCKERSVTAIEAIGYEMIADAFPATGQRLCDAITTGVREPFHNDKMCLFDPSAITRSNFAHGRHTASPEGRVVWPSLPEVLMLHYKALGLDYLLSRSGELRKGLGSRDIEQRWGQQYLWSPEEITKKFNEKKALAKPIPRGAQEVWQQEFARLKGDRTTREAEVQRLSGHAAHSEATVAALEARLAAADLDTARLRHELTAARERLADNEHALSITARELQEVYRSRCWKITQPLRSFRNHLGRRPFASAPS
jgi:Glycosyl transferase family 2